MLDQLDLDVKLKKSEAKEQISELRKQLRATQQLIREARIPVVVLLEGWEAAGKGSTIAELVYPLDPRGFRVRSTERPNEEDLSRPFPWRFWKDLPSRGDFIFFDRSWYRPLLEDRVEEDPGENRVKAMAAEIRELERQLTDDGYVVLKMWLHVSKPEQKKRIAHMEEDRYEKWRLADKDRRPVKSYKKYLRAAEEMLELSNSGNAPWYLIESNNSPFRRVKAMRVLLENLQRALKAKPAPRKKSQAPKENGEEQELRERAKHIEISGPPTVLDTVDLSKKLDRKEYDSRLGPLQDRLRDLMLESHRRNIPVILAFEGWDAAGKGGTIKRLTQELDPRGYEVFPVAAPDAIEKSKHYLWRFWRSLPPQGQLGIFDRSWYGRVLVERVENFATEAEWRRAYDEINGFERQLADWGAVILKFWLHLSPEEQLRRFDEREHVAYKRYKITADDWRNRLKWNDYRMAVGEMLEKTMTTYAPWTIVEAENKLWARVKTLETVVQAVEKRLDE
jgi:polyphosphate:AMP phosphotransferase